MAKLTFAATLLAVAGQAAAQQSAWGQCGGIGWSGATSCVSGYTCSSQNAYYSQCIPGSSGSSGGSSGGNGGSTGTSGNGGTGTSSAQQTLCSQYAYWSGNGYDLNNNLWGESAGSGSQCTYLTGSSSSGVSWYTTWTWSGGQNNVKSYVNSGRQISTGKLISSINSIQSSVSWSYSTTNNVRADVAYDIFTASNPNHSTSSGDYELMIWLDQIGGVEPIGGSPSVSNINLAGHSWNLYVGTVGSQKTFSFVSSSGAITSFSGDIKAFFTYLAQNQGFPQSSQYLLTVQFGTEAFTGGPTQFNVNNWSANVN